MNMPCSNTSLLNQEELKQVKFDKLRDMYESQAIDNIVDRMFDEQLGLLLDIYFDNAPAYLDMKVFAQAIKEHDKTEIGWCVFKALEGIAREYCNQHDKEVWAEINRLREDCNE